MRPYCSTFTQVTKTQCILMSHNVTLFNVVKHIEKMMQSNIPFTFHTVRLFMSAVSYVNAIALDTYNGTYNVGCQHSEYDTV